MYVIIYGSVSVRIKYIMDEGKETTRVITTLYDGVRIILYIYLNICNKGLIWRISNDENKQQIKKRWQNKRRKFKWKRIKSNKVKTKIIRRNKQNWERMCKKRITKNKKLNWRNVWEKSKLRIKKQCNRWNGRRELNKKIQERNSWKN